MAADGWQVGSGRHTNSENTLIAKSLQELGIKIIFGSHRAACEFVVILLTNEYFCNV